ncbi:MAG TPA: sugar ABC transporter substrate-binding protein [Roseiflexaceae bacterium]|nr:sugar ABC transporter substrate-binding protein [Roseiflexaceae bacterium]
MNQQNHTGLSFSPILILLLAAVVAGCGGSPAPAAAPTQAPAATQAPTAAPAPTTAPARTTAPAPNSAPSPTPQPVALTFAFPDDAASAAASMAQIQAYTREHPEVQITAKPLPAADYARQLLDSIDSSAPDLFVSADSLAPALINRKAALDLQGLLGSQSALKPADFAPAALAAWQRGASLYALPADAVPQVLFYNQDLFDAAGVAAPSAGWTWDDWLDKAKQLTVRSGKQITRYGTALSTWAGMVWGNGGELLNESGTQTLLTSPEAIAGVQFAADMVNVHRVAPAPKDAGGPDPVELFKNQQVAMLPGASSLAGRLLEAKLPFKWAIAPLPTGKVAVSPISVSGLAISARSPNAPAALDFATWIVGPAGSALKLDVAPFVAPALRTATAQPGQISGEEAILQALKNGRTQPQVEVWPEVKALVDQALRPVWQGKQSVKAAYRQIEPQVNELLKTG